MSTSTRWHRLFRSLTYNHIPFSLVKSIRVTTKEKKEYTGNDFAAFSKMIEELHKPENNDSISNIIFEPEHRKIRRTIQADVDSYLDNHFPTKPKKS